jgi:hypothetical protein
MTVLEQVNYLIENLSPSPTNEEIVNQLQTVKTVAVMVPSELDPLLEGETRIYYDTPDEFLADFRNGKWEEILKTHNLVSQMAPDGRYVNTIAKGKSESNREAGDRE